MRIKNITKSIKIIFTEVRWEVSRVDMETD